MGFYRVLLISIALLLLGACAAQNKKPKIAEQDHTLKVFAPPWKEGDEWRYSDGYGLVVTGVKGNVTTFQRLDDPKQWFSRYGFLREESQSHDVFRKVVYRSTPPSRGLELSADNGLVFTREYLADKKLRVHRTSWVVEGRETITVPAGKFDCLIIVMRTRSLRSGWHGFERWWYSPKLKYYARIEYKYGSGPISSRVLVSYVVPLTGRQPTKLILDKATAAAKPQKSILIQGNAEKSTTAEAKPEKSVLGKAKVEKSTTAEAKSEKSVLGKAKAKQSLNANAPEVRKDQIGRGNYFVQLGLFRKRNNIHKIYEKLKKRSILVISEKVRRGGNLYEILRVGPYHRKNEANAMADLVNNILGIRSMVLYQGASK